MNVAERYPPTPELAQTYSEHAPAMGMLPNFERGIRYARKSLELRRAFGDRWGVGQSLHYIGAGLYAASRFEESIACCQEAIRLLERTGDRWELNTARWHLAFNHYRRGELAEAADVASVVHRDGIEIGDAQASGISLGAWSKATGGHIPPEMIELELARPVGDIHTRAEVLQAEAIRLIAGGRAGEAVPVLEEAWRLVQEKGLRQEYVSPVLPWLATALRLEAWRTPLSNPRHRRALLRKARSAARRGLRLARRFQNNLPHALREMAQAEAARGRQGTARRLFEQSLRVADDQGARFESLQTLLAKGRTGQSLGWSGAGEEVAKAMRGLAAMRAQPIQEPGTAGSVALALAGNQMTLSLADRFQTLLEVGRRIATGLSREAVFETLREAGETLLRGEECVIMAVPPDGAITDVRAVAGTADLGIEDYLQAIALDAMGKGEILTYSFEGHHDDPLHTRLAFSGIRSALCAPILVRGRPVGCLYVAHRRISGLFDEDERRLAGFIATLGGAALENAAGFAAAQELATSLKRRTSQLEDANRRLDYSVKELTNAYERERQIAGQLNHMAFHDSLTNLPNRVLLSESVEHAVRRAQRSRTNLAVLFLDLDDFKTINDSLGHGAGDELLIAVAQRLRGCVREADTAARISGDEFAILLEDVDHPGGAARSAERILEALQPPFALAGTEVFVRASIGIALGPVGSRSDQASELLRNADLAMYMAKSEKKGSYRFFAPGMHAGLVARLELKADLERALGQRDFTIHYQPIVSLVQGTIDGLEALIRWRHPTRGLMWPSEFLPLAEETGLVRPVGHWVLREACRQAVQWQRRVGDHMPLTISVNLSPSELLEAELVPQVAKALRDSGVRPDRLILELTESVFMQDNEATMERLSGLKRLGVKLAIDDFGTGYSSLGYLQRFPLDRIKVAKQFVDDVSKGAGDSALTRAIIKLGETFELETVAEGIEQPAQLMRLRELGCKLGQGHYFAPALPADEIGELLRDPTPVRNRWQPATFGEPRH
jgi:diguanylate cyclase (GGDEF)-like protein